MQEAGLILGGLVALVTGGELLVRGAVSLALRLGVSALVIGLTLVGFGTSMPELVTSLQAALSGSPGIAIGNVIGSNTANILLILGIAALIFPIAVQPEAFRRDSVVFCAAALAALLITLFGEAGRLTGAGLVLLLLVYVGWTFWQERRSETAASAVYEDEAAFIQPARPSPVWLSLVLVFVGIGLTIFGAKLLVSGAVSLAESLGVSDTIIGLTVVAVGTSLPELVTSVMAALKRQADVAFGNIVGSNIFNIFGILGVTAWVTPLTIPPQILSFDIWVMLAATALLVVFARSGWRVSRREGAGLVALYGAYIVALITVAA